MYPKQSVIKSRGKMDFCLDNLRSRKVMRDQLSLIIDKQKMNVNMNAWIFAEQSGVLKTTRSNQLMLVD